MTDFSKILDKAKELENKMKESQEKIKTIKAEGVSGSNSIKVTLNEFIEISKDYSTSKSSFFINGILDKIVKELQKNNSLIKEGRGLKE